MPGAAGSVGANGANGGGVNSSGGGGGGGGAHGYTGTPLPVGVIPAGGNGGAGGVAITNGGGGGGAGGYGAVVTGSGNLGVLAVPLAGGNGGGGGTGASTSGQGGSGGVGLAFTDAAGVSVTVSSMIRGGNGGGSTGQFGLGGTGLLGQNLTVMISAGGSITGGTAGGVVNVGDVPAQAFGIVLTGGTNSVGGNGTISGGVNIAGGSFQPALTGSVVGTTLNVGGPLVFAAGTSFNIRITPIANDSVTSTTANLGGAGVNVAAGAGTYATRQYTILTATAGFGVTRFGAVTTNLAFLNPTLTYDATNNNVLLNIVGNGVNGAIDYRSAALTQNQFNFATGLTFAGTLNGGDGPILTGFNQLTVPQAQAAFDSLTGEGITGAQNTAFTASRLFTSSIADQILLFGGAPNSVIVPTTTPSSRRSPTAPCRRLPTPIRVRDPHPVAAAVFLARLGVWLRRLAADQRQPCARQRAAVDRHRRRLRRCRLHLGARHADPASRLAGPTARSTSASRQTSGSTTGGHAAFFTLAEFGPVYAASINSVSVFGNRTTRTVAGFGGLNSEILRGNFTSTEFRSRVEFGYRFDVAPGVATLTPFYAVEAAKLRSDGFNETAIAGAGLFALNVRGQTASSVPMFFGVRLTGDMDIGNGMRLRPSIQAAYVPEFAPVRNQVAGLVNLPGATFLTDGARPARSSAQVKAGAELAVLDNVAISANFDGEFSNRSNTYAGKGAIKVRW